LSYDLLLILLVLDLVIALLILIE